MGKGVLKAVANVNEIIAAELKVLMYLNKMPSIK
jgi:enolase